MKGVNQLNVVVVPLTSAGNLIVLKHFRYAVKANVWEFPGGSAQPGKRAEEVARQELLSETGYQCEQMHRLSRKPLYFEPASLDAEYIPFLATKCMKYKEPEPEEEEFIEQLEVSQAEWLTLIDSGEVVDDKTIAVTYLALRYLEHSQF